MRKHLALQRLEFETVAEMQAVAVEMMTRRTPSTPGFLIEFFLGDP